VTEQVQNKVNSSIFGIWKFTSEVLYCNFLPLSLWKLWFSFVTVTCKTERKLL